ncbi:MAG: transferrin-binding protein-like solute binding protein [Pasteurellaceae bacterium]|nr:transferrin-binding protein-like solute binding protein [Pasteurellaceae bacterium]
MKLIAKSSIALLVSSALVACGGTKGSFEVDDVETPQKEIAIPSSKDITTSREQEVELDELMKPAYGYSAKIPRRERVPLPKGQPEANIKQEDIVPLTDFTEAIPYLKELMEDQDSNGIQYTHNESGKKLQQRQGYQYIKTGYTAASATKRVGEISNLSHFSTGNIGYVYYRGQSPASSIPDTTDTVTYQGTWDFVTDAKTPRKRQDGFVRGAGINSGAISSDESVYDGRLGDNHSNGTPYKLGHTSEFSVNFNDKTLTGKLYRNSDPHSETKEQTSTERYAIEANIYGNRFRGKATAKTEHELFKDSSDYLEGGFFGPNAEELAGKFVVPKTATDGSTAYSLFAVFGAKREKAENEQTTTLFDAVKINHDFQANSLDNFGDARKLLIDGQELSLIGTDDQFIYTKSLGKEGAQVVVCCSNLQYTKFGLIQQDNQLAMFLQGERTKASEMQQQTGSVQYKGTWEGRIDASTVWGTSAGNSHGSSRSEFDVDFSNKTIEGRLIAEDSINPAFTLVGEIDGSRFNARASTGSNGLNLDRQNLLNPKLVHFTNVQASGGFFGKNASELGGSFSLNEEGKKIGVVFGAKRQVNE